MYKASCKLTGPGVVHQFEITPKESLEITRIMPKALANFSRCLTPKAFANLSPGLERERQPWVNQEIAINPERVPLKANPFQG